MTRPLTAAGVDWAVVPGVSSAMAAMAAAGIDSSVYSSVSFNKPLKAAAS